MTFMTDIDDLMPYLMRYTPNLPEPTAYDFLREAARDWCQRTKCWREAEEFPIASLDNVHLTTKQDAEVFYIDEAYLDGLPLEPVPIETLDDKYPGWQWAEHEEEGVAQYITQVEPNTIMVYPRQTGHMKARYVLQPSNDAETVPLFLVENFGRYIGIGASARALTMPDTEFANPQLGAFHGNQFEQRMRKYTNVVSKGQQRGRNRTKASYF